MSSNTLELPSGRFFGRRREHCEGRGFRVSESAYRSRERLPVHAHRQAHLCFVVAGRYTEHTPHGEALRRAGDLLYYPAGTDHAEDHHADGRHLLVEIDGRLLERLGPEVSGSQACRGQARWTAGRLAQELKHREVAAGLAIEGLVLQLLAEVSRRSRIQTPPAWIRDARDLLLAELASPPSADHLALRLSLSTQRLQSDLERWEGTRLAGWIRALRVEVAAERLIEGVQPLAEIALATGYCDQSHFTRAFRSATGMTPGRYRKTFGED